MDWPKSIMTPLKATGMFICLLLLYLPFIDSCSLRRLKPTMSLSNIYSLTLAPCQRNQLFTKKIECERAILLQWTHDKFGIHLQNWLIKKD